MLTGPTIWSILKSINDLLHHSKVSCNLGEEYGQEFWTQSIHLVNDDVFVFRQYIHHLYRKNSMLRGEEARIKIWDIDSIVCAFDGCIVKAAEADDKNLHDQTDRHFQWVMFREGNSGESSSDHDLGMIQKTSGTLTINGLNEQQSDDLARLIVKLVKEASHPVNFFDQPYPLWQPDIESMFRLGGWGNDGHTIFGKYPLTEKAPYTCPCCGFRTMNYPPGKGSICPVCNWINDATQLRNPQSDLGSNPLCLEEAQGQFISINEKYVGAEREDVINNFEFNKEWIPLKDIPCEQFRDGITRNHPNACPLEEFYYWRRVIIENDNIFSKFMHNILDKATQSNVKESDVPVIGYGVPYCGKGSCKTCGHKGEASVGQKNGTLRVTCEKCGSHDWMMSEHEPSVEGSLSKQHLLSAIDIIGLAQCDTCGHKGMLSIGHKYNKPVLVCSECGSSDWKMSTSATR